MVNNILVTGANSPIGRYVCNRLAADFPDAKLILSYCHSKPQTDGANTRWVKLDFLGQDVEKAAAEIGPIDTIVHLASLTPGNNTSGKTGDYYIANVHGVMAIIKALVKTGGLKRVFHLSSSAVYNRTKGSVLDELSEKSHEDHYGLSKLVFEREMIELHTHFGVTSLGLRVPVLLTQGVKYNFLSKWKTAIAAGQRLTLANPDAPFNAVCSDSALYQACQTFLNGNSKGCVTQNIFATKATSLRAIFDKIGYKAWDEVEAKGPAQTLTSLYPNRCFPDYSALEVVSAFLA